jgi:hypothetical protein
VSQSKFDSETSPAPADGQHRSDPFHNPSYPRRDHFLAKAKLEEAVRACEERIRSAGQTLSSAANDPRQATFVRLYHQMLAARDQAATSARRMPLETGDLYEHDKERFEQAMAALDRLWQSWEKARG